jgi:hypothetical protein
VSFTHQDAKVATANLFEVVTQLAAVSAALSA